MKIGGKDYSSGDKGSGFIGDFTGPLSDYDSYIGGVSDQMTEHGLRTSNMYNGQAYPQEAGNQAGQQGYQATEGQPANQPQGGYSPQQDETMMMPPSSDELLAKLREASNQYAPSSEQETVVMETQYGDSHPQEPRVVPPVWPAGIPVQYVMEGSYVNLVPKPEIPSFDDVVNQEPMKKRSWVPALVISLVVVVAIAAVGCTAWYFTSKNNSNVKSPVEVIREITKPAPEPEKTVEPTTTPEPTQVPDDTPLDNKNDLDNGLTVDKTQDSQSGNTQEGIQNDMNAAPTRYTPLKNGTSKCGTLRSAQKQYTCATTEGVTDADNSDMSSILTEYGLNEPGKNAGQGRVVDVAGDEQYILYPNGYGLVVNTTLPADDPARVLAFVSSGSQFNDEVKKMIAATNKDLDYAGAISTVGGRQVFTYNQAGKSNQAPLMAIAE